MDTEYKATFDVPHPESPLNVTMYASPRVQVSDSHIKEKLAHDALHALYKEGVEVVKARPVNAFSHSVYALVVRLDWGYTSTAAEWAYRIYDMARFGTALHPNTSNDVRNFLATQNEVHLHRTLDEFYPPWADYLEKRMYTPELRKRFMTRLSDTLLMLGMPTHEYAELLLKREMVSKS